MRVSQLRSLEVLIKFYTGLPRSANEMTCGPDVVLPEELPPRHSAMLSLSLIVVAYTILSLNIASAHSGPCSDAIARLEALVDRSSSIGLAGPTASQSIPAQLHHQPTRESVRRAEIDAKLRLAAILARARTLDAEGRATECMQAVVGAKRLLGLS
jgi:hypothetical protein